MTEEVLKLEDIVSKMQDFINNLYSINKTMSREVVFAAAIWIKTVADQIGHIGEIMNTLTKQSLEDGMYDYRVARTFMNEVDALKASMKWDSIDPNFYMNADTVYMMVKPYVEAMEEGET